MGWDFWIGYALGCALVALAYFFVWSLIDRRRRDEAMPYSWSSDDGLWNVRANTQDIVDRFREEMEKKA